MGKLFFFLLLLPLISFSQTKDTSTVKSVKADIQLYKLYTLKKDTIVIDTSLTITDEYKYNYLRKDNFGLLSFANEGYLYTQLDYSKKKISLFPQFGFNAKHIAYLSDTDISYYSVPTPLTDLYFKTVMRQGQSLDALLSLNTQKNLNFTVAYKAIRSIGDYYNNLTSSGHFRFISSYFSPNKKYYMNSHFVGQDIFNQEYGGLKEVSQFEGNEDSFKQRERIDVFFENASSKLKGNRLFIDHSYKLKESNSLVFKHQAFYEYKFYEFLQSTVSNRLGNAEFTSNLNNKTRFDVFYNKAGVSFLTKKFGELYFFIDNYVYNQFYGSNTSYADLLNMPKNLHNRINTIGGQYDFFHSKWRFNVLAQNSISKRQNSTLEASAKFNFDNINSIEIKAQQTSKIPDNSYLFFQSSYENYNWRNTFKNEKETSLKVNATTKWFSLAAQYSLYNDKMYFYNLAERIDSLVVKPLQFDKSIQYYTIEIAKEFKYKKFGFDNRIKFQDVKQNAKIVNVPYIITRNSLYYMDHVFKSAMLLQTGVTLNYFTNYYADDYNPVLGEFYVQKQTKIGGFPMLDFFVNARVRQVRIYLKAEHFNALFGERNYYNTPNYPYHDFKVRFGLEWNLFK
ncbi:Protein of unknown function precursor [Flavobacterium indicum GPTSA100-9 = DSM 17447]|uniref:Porin n=1 Tax=Flavobacterium indicum (strain DSM 17447 / CIP 109464 / GPTSA100-9) TaxID=1094466 RepID=H8XPM4_FLAIG|nr:putative porin [Flavobacterium indicum]CCG54090.1 Protein of unknown function precursor [Flavobacterium indicum GPTSA100-9 = DSM 17447]